MKRYKTKSLIFSSSCSRGFLWYNHGCDSSHWCWKSSENNFHGACNTDTRATGKTASCDWSTIGNQRTNIHNSRSIGRLDPRHLWQLYGHAALSQRSYVHDHNFLVSRSLVLLKKTTTTGTY